jgi:hypothetical protein
MIRIIAYQAWVKILMGAIPHFIRGQADILMGEITHPFTCHLTALSINLCPHSY